MAGRLPSVYCVRYTYNTHNPTSQRFKVLRVFYHTQQILHNCGLLNQSVYLLISSLCVVYSVLECICSSSECATFLLPQLCAVRFSVLTQLPSYNFQENSLRRVLASETNNILVQNTLFSVKLTNFFILGHKGSSNSIFYHLYLYLVDYNCHAIIRMLCQISSHKRYYVQK
jgi:hypothetical protein